MNYDTINTVERNFDFGGLDERAIYFQYNMS